MSDLQGWGRGAIKWAWNVLLLPEGKEVFKKMMGACQKKKQKKKPKSLFGEASTGQIWGSLSIEIAKNSN